MSVVRCLEDKVHQTSGIMREIELTPIRRVLSLQSNRDVSSACLVKPGSVPSFFKIESNQETKPRVETDDPRQTFVVTDLLDDSQYVVISEPLGNTIIVTAGPAMVMTTSPHADVAELASRAIHESAI